MKILVIIFSSIMLACHVAAQYAIGWFTLDGGGGKSTGGQFRVDGTIAQPDAAAGITSGRFSVLGGFWTTISAVQVPGAPRLTIQPTANQVLVSWPRSATAFTLEQSSTISGNWQAVALPHATNGTSITVHVPISGQMQIFRLRN